MPTATNGGVTLHYETDGDGETVAFISDVGYGAWLWGWQHGAMAGPWETLVWDVRGTGKSDAPPGPYDVETLAADFEAVLGDAGVRRVHVVGAGLGGMVALRYARVYDRARTLTLFGTAADGDAVDETALDGLHPPGDADTLDGAFTPAFRESRPDLIEQIRTWRGEEDADSDAIAAQRAAMTTFEAGPLYELSLPTLVCHGVDDPVVPASAGKRLAEELPRGTYEPVEGRHLCFVEHSRAVSERVVEHIETNSNDA